MLAAETGMTEADIARLVERGGELHHEYREWRQRDPHWSRKHQHRSNDSVDIDGKRWPAGRTPPPGAVGPPRKGLDWEFGR